jgi:phage repressor protein C with HTH and peptisase S24 domain
MDLPKTLKELRIAKDLTRPQLSKALDIRERTYLNYETGEAKPPYETLCTIADFYGVSVDYLLGREKPVSLADLLNRYDLTELEKKFIEIYVSIDKKHRTELCDALEKAAAEVRDEDDDDEPDTPLHIFRTFRRGAAAASWSAGAPTDETECEEVLYDTTGLKQRRDFDKCFVVPVEGDSMSPEYEDGDCVLVHPGLEVGEGDIGIFGMDGEVFIKQLGGNALHSLNDASPEYEDIFGEWETIGKVLGKVIPVAKK